MQKIAKITEIKKSNEGLIAPPIFAVVFFVMSKCSKNFVWNAQEKNDFDLDTIVQCFWNGVSVFIKKCFRIAPLTGGLSPVLIKNSSTKNQSFFPSSNKCPVWTFQKAEKSVWTN